MHPVVEKLGLALRAGYPFVHLQTWEERRALRELAELADSVDRKLWTWKVTGGFQGEGAPDGCEEPDDALRWLRQAPADVLIVMLDFHRHADDARISRQLRDLRGPLVDQRRGLIFLDHHVFIPDELDKDWTVFQLPLPDLKDVARAFHRVLREDESEVDLELFERFVKASLGLTEDEIERLYRKVLIEHGRFGEEQLADIISEKRQIIRKAEYLEFQDFSQSMTEVGGLDNLKEWLVARKNAFSEKARKYGLPQPKGLFLLGVQGCGKSLTAKAVADLWKVPLLRLDVGALVLGRKGAEEGLRRTIAIAESMAPAILWVDEIEKAFAGVESGGDEGSNAARVFGGFITWLQEKQAPVFVVATANDVRHLPPELLRKGRFDEIFWIDLPNVHERNTIFEIHLRRRGRDPALFETWRLAEASERFSGAEIEQVIIDALFTGFHADREATAADILRAIRETVPLAITMDQTIKRLKEWARDRTRPATYDSRRVDFFADWQKAQA